MKFLPTRKQWPILVALMAIMLVTRYHHIGSILHLKDASMGIFFAAGFWLGGTLALPLLMLEAVLIDWYAISVAGVSDFCVTPAYSMLAVAYAVLWYGGSWYARRHYAPKLATLVPLALVAVLSTTLSFIVSNGAFYWLGGRYANPHFAEYVDRLALYLPSFVTVALLWIGAFAVAQAFAVWLGARSSEGSTHA
jgi:hypothetical protein